MSIDKYHLLLFFFLDWPTIIPNDGLIIVNQSMRKDCDTCKISSSIPRISNVIVISVQPERNIQLFPNNSELYKYLHTPTHLLLVSQSVLTLSSLHFVVSVNVFNPSTPQIPIPLWPMSWFSHKILVLWVPPSPLVLPRPVRRTTSSILHSLEQERVQEHLIWTLVSCDQTVFCSWSWCTLNDKWMLQEKDVLNLKKLY